MTFWDNNTNDTTYNLQQKINNLEEEIVKLKAQIEMLNQKLVEAQIYGNLKQEKML